MDFFSSIGQLVSDKVHKISERVAIGADGRDSRVIAKSAFRSCTTAMVSHDEIVKKLLQNQYFKDKKYSTHAFFATASIAATNTNADDLPDQDVADAVEQLESTPETEKPVEVPAVTAAVAENADAAPATEEVKAEDATIVPEVAAVEPAVVEPVVAAAEAVVEPVVVPAAEPVAPVVTYPDFIPLQTVLDIIVDILQLAPEKRTEKMFRELRKACFKCPSTHVDINEYARRIYETDVFGTESIAEHIPPRGTEPFFVSHPLFLNRSPLRITWPQVEALYIQYCAFAKKIVAVDNLFIKEQSNAFKQRTDQSSREHNRQRQIEGTPVSIMSFTARLQRKNIFPTNSPFWSSASWVEWSSVTDPLKTIEWDQVYNGLQEICPEVPSVSEAFNAMVADEERKADAEGRGSAENSITRLNNDDAAARAYSLELQITQYQTHTEELTQENALLRKRITEQEDLLQSLKDGPAGNWETERDQHIEHIRQLQQSQRDQALIQSQLHEQVVRQQQLIERLRAQEPEAFEEIGIAALNQAVNQEAKETADELSKQLQNQMDAQAQLQKEVVQLQQLIDRLRAQDPAAYAELGIVMLSQAVQPVVTNAVGGTVTAFTNILADVQSSAVNNLNNTAQMLASIPLNSSSSGVSYRKTFRQRRTGY